MDQPIACSLSSAGLAERVRQLAALRRNAMLDRSPIAGGERLVFADAPGIESSLREAIAAFAEAYADQNERDHAALVEAVREGRVTAEREP